MTADEIRAMTEYDLGKFLKKTIGKDVPSECYWYAISWDALGVIWQVWNKVPQSRGLTLKSSPGDPWEAIAWQVSGRRDYLRTFLATESTAPLAVARAVALALVEMGESDA